MATTQKANGEAPATLPARQQARPIDTLRDLLEKSKGQIAKALPRHLHADRMIRVAVTALQRGPGAAKLLQCDPLSVVGCVMQAAELGLELSGPLGQAYMVPYGNQAQFQIGYRGLIRLAYNSGQVSTFNAHVVYQGDKFSFRYGTRPELDHVPAMSGRGQPVAVYAVLRLKDGSTDFEVMSVEDVNRHRQRYSKAGGKDSPWESAWDEMARKTVIRRLAKRAPLSAECQAAAVEDEQTEARLDAPAVVGGRFAELGDGGADPVAAAEGEVIDAGDARE